MKSVVITDEQMDVLRWAATVGLEAKDVCDAIELSEAVTKYKLKQIKERDGTGV